MVDRRLPAGVDLAARCTAAAATSFPFDEMIDITFDFRSDTPPGKDPDTFSPTLRTYHQLLWNKPLPSGELFELDVTGPPYYLRHRSELGEFWLSSDTVIPSFRWLAPIIDQIPETAREKFMHIGYTIGGMMVFPANRVDGKMTINQRRGCHHADQGPVRPDAGVHPPALPRRAQPAGRHARPVRRLLRTVRRLRGLRRLFPPAGRGQRRHFDRQVLHAIRGLRRLARCRQPSMRIWHTANAPSSSLNPAIGGSPLTSVKATDPLGHTSRPNRRVPSRTHSPATRGSSCASVRWQIDR